MRSDRGNPVRVMFCGLALAICFSVPGPGFAAVGTELLPSEAPPGPKCYRKAQIPAEYETSRRLVRKARLKHEETETGQIKMIHYPAIYVEEKTLKEAAYVLLQEVECTRRILRKAIKLPPEQCMETRGCRELD